MDRRYRPQERLRTRREIDRVLRGGARAADGVLRVFAIGSDRPRARFAPVVPGRLCGAVQRNRWKRLLRESFRLNKEAFGDGVDVVVMPLRPPGQIKQEQVARSMLGLFQRVRS